MPRRWPRPTWSPSPRRPPSRTCWTRSTRPALSGLRAVSIGPVTSETLRAHGVEPLVEADPARRRRAGRGRAAGGGVESDRDGRPVVTFLSDFGSVDPFVGICHGVIVRICPEAEVIHLATGSSRSRSGRGRGCWRRRCRTCRWACTWRWSTPASDPSGGRSCLRSGRRPAVRRARQRAADRRPPRRAAASSWRSRSPAASYMLRQVSRTFHGRDVFAPVSGHLAGGPRSRASWGTRSTRRRWCARAAAGDSSVDGTLLTARPSSTSTGSATSSCRRRWPTSASCSRAGAQGRGRRAATTATSRSARARSPTSSRGELVLYEDSEQRLSIAINRGNAAELMDADARRPGADRVRAGVS